MTQTLILFAVFLLILNPAGSGLRWRSLSEDRIRLAIGLGATAVAGVGLVILAALGSELLEVLETPSATFQVGAGILLFIDALRTVLQRQPFRPELMAAERYESLFAGSRLALSLATPAALAAAAFYGADRGVAETMVAVAAAAIVVAVVIILAAQPRAERYQVVLREIGRATAAILIVVAVDLIIDGVIAV